jgi:hypothetical protein
MISTVEHPRLGTLRTGRLPRTFGHVATVARLRAERGISLPPLPASLNNAKSTDIAHMFLNDQHGDCTCAGMANLIDLVTYDAQGGQAPIVDAQVLAAYEAVGGYRPGDPSTDNGANEQDVLRWWQTVGFPLEDGSHLRAGPAFEVNPRDTNGICEVIANFGAAYIGFSVPAGFMFELPPIWYDNPAYGAIEGGHCVLLHSWEPAAAPGLRQFGVTTWGTNAEFKMREDFVGKYVDEVYGVVLSPWIESKGTTPYGLTLEQLTSLGGEVGQQL